MYYILKDKKVHKAKDVNEWSKFFSDFSNRLVKSTIICENVSVSTVFLGLDHSFSRLFEDKSEHPILVFETLVFGGEFDGQMFRYTTWEQAEKGHEEMIKKVKH